MRFLLRIVLFLIGVAALAYGGAYYYAGTLPGPVIEIRSPEKFVGQTSQLEFSVETPDGQFTKVDAVLEQGGQSTAVFSTDPSQPPAGEVKQDAANRMYVIRPIGKQALPNLKSGPAKVDSHGDTARRLRHPHGANQRHVVISKSGSNRRG